jgi:hypothetical protein
MSTPTSIDWVRSKPYLRSRPLKWSAQGASDWEHHAAAEEEREEQEGFVEAVNRLRREEGFDQMQVLNPVSWGEDSSK